MGTNYYIRYNICKCCDKYDEFHIGKNSMGWQFTFQKISSNDEINLKHLDPKTMLLDKDIYVELKSFTDWESFIKKYVVDFETAKIYDEYDKEITPLDFFNMIKEKQTPENKIHTIEVNDNNSYLDLQGHCFIRGDFS